MSDVLWSIFGFLLSPQGLLLIAHLILFMMYAVPIFIIWVVVRHVRQKRAFAAATQRDPNVTVLIPRAKSQLVSDECGVNAHDTCTRAWCICTCH